MKNFEEIIRAINPENEYTVKEIAELIGVSKAAIIQHIRRETFKGRKIFGKYYVNGREVRDYFAK